MSTISTIFPRQRLFVTFSVFGSEIKGRITGGTTPGQPKKIAFVEGYNREFPKDYNGFLPASREEWLCELARDTKPGQPYGAYIVAPMRPSRWEWREVGPEVGGVREQRPVCVDEPSRPAGESPFSTEAQAAKNAPYYQACRRARILAAPFASAESFWALAASEGAPDSAEVQGGKILFKYAGGLVVTAAPEDLARLGWPFFQVRWKHVGPDISCVGELGWPRAQFVVPVARMCGANLEGVDPFWSLLTERSREIVRAAAREEHSPEKAAKRDMDQRRAADPEFSKEMLENLVDLQRPGACYLRPCPDKPGKMRLYTGGRYPLGLTGPHDIRGGSLCCELDAHPSAEAAREAALRQVRDEARRYFAADLTGHSSNLFDPKEWSDRYLELWEWLCENILMEIEARAEASLKVMRSAEEDYERAVDEVRALRAEVDRFWHEVEVAGASRWDLPTEVPIPSGACTPAGVREAAEPTRQWLKIARAQLATAKPARGQAARAAANLSDLQGKFNRRK